MRFVITLLVLAGVCGSGKMTSPAMLAANKALVLLNAEEGSSRTLVKIQHVSMNEKKSGTTYYFRLQVNNGNSIEECYLELWVGDHASNAQKLQVKRCGGFKNLLPSTNTSDYNFHNASVFATEDFNNDTHDRFLFFPQTMAGKQEQRGDARLLIITMDMIESICEKTIKNRGKNTSECPRKPGGKLAECKFHILDEPKQTPRFTMERSMCRIYYQ